MSETGISTCSVMTAITTFTSPIIELKQDINPKARLSCQTGNSACVTLRASMNAINAIDAPFSVRLISCFFRALALRPHHSPKNDEILLIN